MGDFYDDLGMNFKELSDQNRAAIAIIARVEKFHARLKEEILKDSLSFDEDNTLRRIEEMFRLIVKGGHGRV